MSASTSPIICVTCKRALPDDLKADDAPRYFAQQPLLPRSDDDHDFKNEAAEIVGYIESVSYVTRWASEVEDEHAKTLFDLVFPLSEEAKRRLDLCDDAMRERYAREQEAKKARHAHKEEV